MRVYLNHIDSKRFHSVYHELLKEPCAEYVLRGAGKDGGNPGPAFMLGKFFVNLLSTPTVNFVRRSDFDLIHSSQSIPISKKPYVLDFEHISALGGWNYNRINSKFFKSLLNQFLESKRCKKIMPWTKASMYSLERLIGGKKIKEKTEVVYPAISVKNIKRKKKTGSKVIFLFVAYNFQRKGGDEALKAFNLLSKDKNNIELWIISNKITGNILYDKEKVKFFGLKNKKEIYKNFYSKADIFVFPTFNDTYGMVFLEAMAYGLPVITLDEFASEEIIEHGKNGFIVKGYKKRWYDENYQSRFGSNILENVVNWRTEEESQRIVKDLYEYMKRLAGNRHLITKMKKNNIEKTTTGIFSTAYRNRQLKRLYEEATS